MPRSGVTTRWIVCCSWPAALIFGGCRLRGRAWWSKNNRRASLLEQSRAAYLQKDWPTARTKAFAQLKTSPADPVALRLLGRALYRLGRDQDATAIFERLTPESMEAEDYLVRGQASIRSQNVKLAVENLQKALQLDPDHFESRVTLEQVFFRQDRLVEADRETERLLALPGREAVGELMRGQIRFQQSDTAAAALHFERALRHPEQWDFIGDPNFFRKQLARSLLGIGQPAPARDSLRSLTDDPQDPKTSWLLSRCDLQEAFPSRGGCFCRGPFVSPVKAQVELRTGPVRRRSPKVPGATLGSSATTQQELPRSPLTLSQGPVSRRIDMFLCSSQSPDPCNAQCLARLPQTRRQP